MVDTELNVQYKVADFVNAAMAYRKFTGDYKIFIIVVWILVALIISYLFPAFVFPLALCIAKSCPSEYVNKITQLGVIGLFVCVVLLALAYSNILFHIRMELTYKFLFNKFKEEYQATHKIAPAIDGLDFYNQTNKITQFWNSFLELHETRDAFLLIIKKYQYILIPKRCFLNSSDIDSFREIIIDKTGKKFQ